MDFFPELDWVQLFRPNIDFIGSLQPSKSETPRIRLMNVPGKNEQRFVIILLRGGSYAASKWNDRGGEGREKNSERIARKNIFALATDFFSPKRKIEEFSNIGF